MKLNAIIEFWLFLGKFLIALHAVTTRMNYFAGVKIVSHNLSVSYSIIKRPQRAGINL